MSVSSDGRVVTWTIVKVIDCLCTCTVYMCGSVCVNIDKCSYCMYVIPIQHNSKLHVDLHVPPRHQLTCTVLDNVHFKLVHVHVHVLIHVYTL